MAPGARNKFAAHMFELEVFRKKMKAYCFEKVLMTLFGTFWSPCSDSSPGELCPPAPLVTPLVYMQ